MKYHHGGHHRQHQAWQGMQRPAAQVNVLETDDRYELHLIAAGRRRDDFRVEIKDDLLTIHVAKPQEEEVTKEQWQRREFRFRDFERSFQLSDKIDADAITVAYDAGILKLTLPKHPDKVTQRREFEIS